MGLILPGKEKVNGHGGGLFRQQAVEHRIQRSVIEGLELRALGIEAPGGAEAQAPGDRGWGGRGRKGIEVRTLLASEGQEILKARLPQVRRARDLALKRRIRGHGGAVNQLGFGPQGVWIEAEMA